MHSVVSYIKKEKKKNEKGGGDLQKLDFSKPRERVRLISKFLGDSTVEIIRSKKESHSTRRGLRMDSGFKEFQQTP